MNDPVKSPSHYQFDWSCTEVKHVIEDRTLKYIDSELPASKLYQYLNAIKYVLRAPSKSPWQDIAKAHEVLGDMLSARPEPIKYD